MYQDTYQRKKSQIFDDCFYGNVEAVKRAIENKEDFINSSGWSETITPNSQDPHDNSLLAWACRGTTRGHQELVEYLLKEGAEVNTQSKGGYTPLRHACEAGSLAIAKILLEKGAETEVFGGVWKWSPLGAACKEGHFDIVKLLVENGAAVNVDVFDRSPLRIACSADQNKQKIIDFLLKNGANPYIGGDWEIKFKNDNSIKVEETGTLIKAICEYGGGVETLKILIDNGFKVDYQYPDGSFPLSIIYSDLNAYVSESDKKEAVKLLVERGPKIDANVSYDYAKIVFYAGIFCEIEDIAKSVIDSGLDLNYEIDHRTFGQILKQKAQYQDLDLTDYIKSKLTKKKVEFSKERLQELSKKQNQTFEEEYPKVQNLEDLKNKMKEINKAFWKSNGEKRKLLEKQWNELLEERSKLHTQDRGKWEPKQVEQKLDNNNNNNNNNIPDDLSDLIDINSKYEKEEVKELGNSSDNEE